MVPLPQHQRARQPKAVAEAAGVVGYHINRPYSSLGWLGWAQIARSREEAAGNDAALKTLKNTVLGETWKDRGEAPGWQWLHERREKNQPGHVPAGVQGAAVSSPMPDRPPKRTGPI